MTNLEKIAVFLRFWYSPWGAAKAAIWEWFDGDRLAFGGDAQAMTIIGNIMNGEDRYDWSALDSFWQELKKETGR